MDIIKTKKLMNEKRPTFTRTDAHKKKRVGTGWRRPKGLQNKMKLQKKGYRKTVKPGYKSPSALLHTKQGLLITRVSNIKELEALNPKTQAALLAKVGRKSKEELIEAAKKKNITLVNLSVKSYTQKTQLLAKEKEEKKKKLLAEKKAQEKKKTAEKAAAEKAAEEQAHDLSEEEKKKQEKAEKDKVLTSKKGY